MEIIDPRGTNYSRQGHPRVHMAAIENRMGRYGIGIKKGSNGERVSFRDIPLARLVTTLNEKLKRVITVEEYFRIYDQDSDGFLKPVEFFKAVLEINAGLEDTQIQRIAQKLMDYKVYEGKNCGRLARIDINEIETLFMKISQEEEMLKAKNSGTSQAKTANVLIIDLVTFTGILQEFDGFTKPQRLRVQLTYSVDNFLKDAQYKMNKNTIRSTVLLSKQA